MAEVKEAHRRTQDRFMSSPFSVEAVALLEEVGMSRYKVPSGEVTNLPFILQSLSRQASRAMEGGLHLLQDQVLCREIENVSHGIPLGSVENL
jgi:N-acetylneuraminate synthase